MVKVSIIVPVYNVERYLEKCLDTLIHQTLNEIEIIVVNDGATDGSAKIIDKYAKKSDKIISLTKKNGGLSDARNYGLPYATGEYIGYVDSDDYVELDMYELLYKKAKEDDSDIVECNLCHTYATSEDVEVGTKITDKKEMLMNGRSVVWNKIYKRSWLLNTKVTFHKGLIYEDVEFYLKLIPYINRYSYIDNACIHYVQRESSINNLSSKKTLDILTILSTIYDYYKKNGFLEEYKEALEFFYTRILLCSSFSRMCKIGVRRDRKMALKENYSLLETKFPNWKKNKYLRLRKSSRYLFMRSVNKFTYKIYSVVFSFGFRAKRFLYSNKVS